MVERDCVHGHLWWKTVNCDDFDDVLVPAIWTKIATFIWSPLFLLILLAPS